MPKVVMPTTWRMKATTVAITVSETASPSGVKVRLPNEVPSERSMAGCELINAKRIKEEMPESRLKATANVC